MKDIKTRIEYLTAAIHEFNDYPAVVEVLNKRLTNLIKMKIVNEEEGNIRSL